MRTAQTITLSSEEGSTLLKWSKGRSIAHRLVLRSKIILLAAAGKRSQDIAKELKISRPTVQLWRDRFVQSRTNGIVKDAQRSGRIPKLSPMKERRIVEATLQTNPPHATHWSVRTMAQAQHVSRMTVQRVWEKHNLKP